MARGRVGRRALHKLSVHDCPMLRLISAASSVVRVEGSENEGEGGVKMRTCLPRTQVQLVSA